MQNVEAEAQQDIQILRLDRLQGLGREAMNKLLADRLDLDAIDAGQKLGAVHTFQRMILWFLLRVVAEVVVVERVLAESGIEQPAHRLGEERICFAGLFRGSGRFTKNQQFDVREIAGLDVLEKGCEESGKIVAVEQNS